MATSELLLTVDEAAKRLSIGRSRLYGLMNKGQIQSVVVGERSQDGFLQVKSDYKRLLGYLSKARKRFYGPWRPGTLADDSTAAVVRCDGFESGQDWVDALGHRLSCKLERWRSQAVYVEVWFEAAAMGSQFAHHTNENITLLAFHGDVSIPEKWKAARRLARRWLELRKPSRCCTTATWMTRGC